MNTQWERQDGEQPRAFRAFCIFRDQGPDRTVRETARQLTEIANAQKALAASRKNPGVDLEKRGRPGAISAVILAQVVDWASFWSWEDRGLAWDDECDRIRRGAHLSEVADMSKQQVLQSQAAASTLMAPITAFLTRLRDQDYRKQLEAMDMDKLARLSIIATRVLPRVMEAERRARGEPDPAKGIRKDTQFDISKLLDGI